ncbi:LapA family protein [Sphaerotilus mobilis]|uniref:Putative integral membrane protein n=1 Tax=Sphaerotilus mobilis TaxID=47994 RepID=A0A4Q7LAK8_9BURK|nr:LapA family protein [Sphaerotilus mobilis]RZS47539.1 putative integral membrane protein [Sphaerotilus mobilis]
MRILIWAVRAALFFVLFAFALNNQHVVLLHWFFGVSTQAPMVLVVLVTFAAGCAAGVFAMLPGWWRQHRRTRALEAAVPRTSAPPMSPGATAASATRPAPLATEPELPHPPRDGL